MLEESEATNGSNRSPEDDFFCVKYGVWYPMRDCNYRVLHRTFEGCVSCFQGRINLRRLHRRTSTSSSSLRPGKLLLFPEEPESRPFASAPGAIPPKG